jgi:hypothetical protein
MLIELIEHSTALAVTIIAVALLNYGAGRLTLRMESRQHIFVHAALKQPVAGLTKQAQLALPFIAAVPIAALTLLADANSREALSGGYLVMQVATLVISLDSLLRLQVATVPGIADGRVILSAQFQYRSVAARISAAAIFCEIVAACFGNFTFATGGIFLFATAVGYYRRAIRASKDTSSNT